MEDNCDIFLTSRHESASHQNQNFHWALHFAVKSRLKRVPELDFKTPQAKIEDLEIMKLLPTKRTVDALSATLPHLVARVVTRYMKAYKKFKSTVIHHISHGYSKEMATPSEQVSSSKSIYFSCKFSFAI